MASSCPQPRNRHIVAVIALLVSSVGGFVATPLQAPTQHQHHRQCSKSFARHCCGSAEATGPTHRSTLVCTLPESSDCSRLALKNGFGERRLGGQRRQRLGSILSSSTGSKSPLSYFLGGCTGCPPRKGSVKMLLHSPRHSKKPSSSGDSAGIAGHAAEMEAAALHSSAAAEVEGSSNSTVSSTDGPTINGTEAGAKSSSPSRVPKGKGVAGTTPASGKSGGVRGMSVPVVSTEGNVTAHANVTRTDLNGSKTVMRRSRSSSSSTAPSHGTPISLPTSRSGKMDKGVAAAGESKTGRVASRTRKLKRPVRAPSSGDVPRESARRRRPLVVTDDMALADVTSLVKEVLERVSETERELKRLRKEGSVPKTARSSVRERKFVIDTRAKMLGAAFAGCVAGMIVGWSVLPNLWLVGAVAGAAACSTLSRTTGTVGSLCSTCGIQVALIYKDVRDWWEQTVFLYKTGKLSYTYWKGFEQYDKAWGLTDKYNNTLSKLSKEALELDRQYKIRTKALRAGKRVTKLSREVGSSAVKEVTQFAGTATGWGSNQLRQWGLFGDELEDKGARGFGLLKKGKGKGVRAGGKRPLGFSIDLSGMFGEKDRSLYSAPAAGGTRKPGYRGEPVIPARIRHLWMTPKQIRDERLRKYRVGFLGMRIPRSFDKGD